MDFKVFYDRITQLRVQQTSLYLGHSCGYVSRILSDLFPKDSHPTHLMSNIRRLIMNVGNIQADTIAI